MALDLGELVARLRVDDSQYTAGLKAAPATARTAGQQIGDGLIRGADGRLRDARGRFVRAGQDAGTGVGEGLERGFKPSLGRITGLLATIGLGKLAIDAAKFGVDVYSSNEKAAISFTTMLGSAEKAQAFLGQMKDFAAATPFEFPELQTASSRLISAGIESGKVIPIMKTLGDVTSGMGTGSDGINRATVALQQMQAAGRITGEDLNQLRDAGIPVYDLLAAATGKSKEEVVKLAQAGKLGKTELDAMMGALESGKGLEKFSGLMEAQAQSLDGMMSNLKDTLGQGLATAIDESGLDDTLKGAITGITAALPGLIGGLKETITFLGSVGSWVSEHSGMLASLATILGVLAGGFVALSIAQSVASAGGFLTWVTGVMKATQAWTAVQWLLNVAMNANPIGLIVIAIAALVAGIIVAYNTSEDFRNIVNGAFTAVGEMGRWLWNKALAPALRAIVNGFAWVVEGIANMLDALGNVPGFEWAKEAAGKLRGMAEQARNAAKGIKDIPASKSVKISITVGGADKLDAAARNFRALGIMGARARGGPVARGGLYLVGEEGPELVRFDNAGTVYPAGQTRQMLASGSRSGIGQASGAGGGGGLDVGAIRRAMEGMTMNARFDNIDRLATYTTARVVLAAERL